MYLRAALSSFFLTVVLLLTGGVTHALEPEEILILKTGPLSFRPQMSLSEQYIDNIFYQENEEVSDFITVVSPGLKLQLGRLDHNYIQVDYSYDHRFYVDNSELNAGQHTVDLSNQFQFERLKLVGSDRVQLLSNPLSGVVERIIDTNGVATFVRGNVDRLSFNDDYTLSYDVGEKTSVYLRASHFNVDYQQGIALYDLQRVSGTAGFGYRAFPKTVVFGEIYYGQTSTDPNDPVLISNPDLRFVGGYAGVRGNFTPKLSGMAKAGYEAREFSDSSEAPSEPVVDLSLSYQFSPKRMVALTYSRQNSVSVQYSRQTYTADTLGAQLVQVLGPSRKWQATVRGSYSLYEYDLNSQPSGRVQYDYFRGSFSLAYQIQRWLTASCGYDFEHVSGDTQAVIDYSVNRVSLRLAIGY